MASIIHLDNLLNPITGALSPEAARQLAELRIDPATQARLDELAEKSTEDALTGEERAEYEVYVHAIYFLTALQAQAKQRLASRRV
jgi:uncharacterized protein YnzC (UPF0291/DUF896 family)